MIKGRLNMYRKLFVFIACGLLAQQGLGAITFVAESSSVNSSSTSRTPSEPTGTAENDVVIAFCTISTEDGTWTDPADFTEIYQNAETGTTGITVNSYLGYKKRGADAGSGYAFSNSGTGGGIRCTLTTYRGVDTTTQLDVTWVTGSHYSTFENDNTVANPAITTATNGAWVLLFQYSWDASQTHVAPTNYTLRIDYATGSGRTQASASREITTATTETPGEWNHTSWNASADGVHYTIALKPLAASTLSFSAGPTFTPATNGQTIGGTLTDVDGTPTVYASAWPPAASAPADCDAVIAGSGAVITASDATWVEDVGDSFAATAANSVPRLDWYVCAADDSNQTAVTAAADQDRSADAGQTIVALTSVSGTSAFAVHSDSTCDTDGSTAVITGCDSGFLAKLQDGMLVDVSAGFADETDRIVACVNGSNGLCSSGELALDAVSDSAETDMTVAIDLYYSATVAAGDVVEHDNLTGIGQSGVHDGSDNASVLTNSAASWAVNIHAGNQLYNDTDSSECQIVSNTATTITCTLSGGTDNDWDTDDVYTIKYAVTIGVDGELSFDGSDGAQETVAYAIEDVSDATDAEFTNPPFSPDDKFYFFDTRPEWTDLGLFPLVLTTDEAMAPIDFTDNCSHANGNALSFAIESGTPPTGTGLSGTGNKDFDGTPTVEDESGVTLRIRCTEAGGLVVESPDLAIFVVTTWTVSDYDALDENDVNAAYFSDAAWAQALGFSVTQNLVCSGEAAGEVVNGSQSPAASAEAAYDAEVSVSISTGVACDASPPVCETDLTFVFDEDMAINTEAFANYCEADEAPTFAVTMGTLPNGLSLAANGDLTGTPDTADVMGAAVEITATEPSSMLTDTIDNTFYIPPAAGVALPDYVGDTQAEATVKHDAAFPWQSAFGLLRITFEQDCSGMGTLGEVTSQDPAASTEVGPFDQVTVQVASTCGRPSIRPPRVDIRIGEIIDVPSPRAANDSLYDLKIAA